MRTYIQTNGVQRSQILARFGLTEMGLWKILNFFTASNRADDVRQYVLANGGKIVVEQEFRPVSSPVHDEVNRTMTYPFAHGVTLTIYKEDSSAVIRREGKVMEEYVDVDARNWGNLLYRANELAEAANAQPMEQEYHTLTPVELIKKYEESKASKNKTGLPTSGFPYRNS